MSIREGALMGGERTAVSLRRNAWTYSASDCTGKWNGRSFAQELPKRGGKWSEESLSGLLQVIKVALFLFVLVVCLLAPFIQVSGVWSGCCRPVCVVVGSIQFVYPKAPVCGRRTFVNRTTSKPFSRGFFRTTSWRRWFVQVGFSWNGKSGCHYCFTKNKLAKLSINYVISRTHSWRISQFYIKQHQTPVSEIEQKDTMNYLEQQTRTT